MKQKFSHRSKKVLMTGMSGTGKTTLFFAKIDEEKAAYKFVYDSQGEFSSRFGLQAVYDGEGILKSVEQGGWVCYDPVDSIESIEEAGLADDADADPLQAFLSLVFAVCKEVPGRKLVVIDELDDLTDVSNTPSKLLTLLRTGRRYQVDFYAICQGTNSLHNRVRQQITEIYAFAQGDDNATKWLVSRGMPEEKLLALPPGKYLYKNRNSPKVIEGGKAF